MDDVLDLIERGGAWRSPHHVPGVARVPARRLVIVTCMDARIDAPRIHGLGPGDAHVLRNAGAVVTDDVERSVLLSQYALETTTVLVIGHTDCGLLGHDEQATAMAVEAHRGTRPTIELGSLQSVEAGVRAGVARLRASAWLRHVDDIHGLIHDVDTGELRLVAPEGPAVEGLATQG